MSPNDSITSKRFVAILNRVVELDRGPQALLDWVRARLHSNSPLRPDCDDPSVQRLAAELDELLRSRFATHQTTLKRVSGTLTQRFMG